MANKASKPPKNPFGAIVNDAPKNAAKVNSGPGTA